MGAADGSVVGEALGLRDGAAVGSCVGAAEGDVEGASDGACEHKRPQHGRRVSIGAAAR